MLLYIRDQYEKKKNLESIMKVLNCLWESKFLKETEQIVRMLYNDKDKTPSRIVDHLKSKGALMEMLVQGYEEMRPIFKGVVDSFKWENAEALGFGRSSIKKPDRTMRVFV